MNFILKKVIAKPRFRSFLRKAGIVKVLNTVLKKNKDYEYFFDKAMMSSINQGDIVWDVGANIGFYTCKFAKAVGNTGKIVAFEPVRSTYLRMLKACEQQELNNVISYNCALGHCDESFSISITTDGDGVTNSLHNKDENGNGEMITVRRGDSLINEGIPIPNVIKIDVEAFEEEVIFGLKNWLFSRAEGTVYQIFCEMHFEQLDKRGCKNAPTRILSLLKDAGFSIQWIDASHFHAKK